MSSPSFRARALSSLAGLALVLPTTACAEGDPVAGEAKAAVCIACHGIGGNSTNPAWPKLAGQHQRYLVLQLEAFKSGARRNPLMQPQAANLSREDMEDLAAYFASQPPTAPSR